MLTVTDNDPVRDLILHLWTLIKKLQPKIEENQIHLCTEILSVVILPRKLEMGKQITLLSKSEHTKYAFPLYDILGINIS